MPSPPMNFTYLQQRRKKTLEIGRELVQCTSLLLAIAVSANLDEPRHTCFQPAEIPLLELRIVPQLLYRTRTEFTVVCEIYTIT